MKMFYRKKAYVSLYIEPKISRVLTPEEIGEFEEFIFKNFSQNTYRIPFSLVVSKELNILFVEFHKSTLSRIKLYEENLNLLYTDIKLKFKDYYILWT